MESWRHAFRVGFAPQFSTAGLEALRRALLDDDERLLQGATTSPPPLAEVCGWPCEAACAVGWCGWHGEGLRTVAEVEEYFAQACFRCDLTLGEPAACRWLLNWLDDTPRPSMRRQLLAEVEHELAARAAAEEALPCVIVPTCGPSATAWRSSSAFTTTLGGK